MADFSLSVWVLLAGVGAAAVLAFLWTATMHARNQCHLHSLKAEVAELRIRYQKHLREQDDKHKAGAAARRAAQQPKPPATESSSPQPPAAEPTTSETTPAEPGPAATPSAEPQQTEPSSQAA